MASLTTKAFRIVEPQEHSSFLVLPTEIRQKILLYTITDEELEADIRHVCYLSYGEECIGEFFFYEKNMMVWAEMLKAVHPVVEEDMRFVMKKWKNRGNGLLDEEPEYWYMYDRYCI
jgi:hypothetical protein